MTEDLLDDRPDLVTIDLSLVHTAAELHLKLMESLGFPDFYGCNWHAFWDAITGLVAIPKKLVILGWGHVQQVLPKDAQIMAEQLENLNEQFPSWACNVEYH